MTLTFFLFGAGPVLLRVHACAQSQPGASTCPLLTSARVTSEADAAAAVAATTTPRALQPQLVTAATATVVDTTLCIVEQRSRTKLCLWTQLVCQVCCARGCAARRLGLGLAQRLGSARRLAQLGSAAACRARRSAPRPRVSRRPTTPARRAQDA